MATIYVGYGDVPSTLTDSLSKKSEREKKRKKKEKEKERGGKAERLARWKEDETTITVRVIPVG